VWYSIVDVVRQLVHYYYHCAYSVSVVVAAVAVVDNGFVDGMDVTCVAEGIVGVVVSDTVGTAEEHAVGDIPVVGTG